MWRTVGTMQERQSLWVRVGWSVVLLTALAGIVGCGGSAPAEVVGAQGSGPVIVPPLNPPPPTVPRPTPTAPPSTPATLTTAPPGVAALADGERLVVAGVVVQLGSAVEPAGDAAKIGAWETETSSRWKVAGTELDAYVLTNAEDGDIRSLARYQEALEAVGMSGATTDVIDGQIGDERNCSYARSMSGARFVTALFVSNKNTEHASFALIGDSVGLAADIDARLLSGLIETLCPRTT
jgi:hypothetical protein